MGLLALMGEAAGALMLIEKLTENPKARSSRDFSKVTAMRDAREVANRTGKSAVVYRIGRHYNFSFGKVPADATPIVRIEPQRGVNPRGRSKGSVKRASQATGRKPTKRLVKRRTKTKAAPKGFFANPSYSNIEKSAFKRGIWKYVGYGFDSVYSIGNVGPGGRWAALRSKGSGPSAIYANSLASLSKKLSEKVSQNPVKHGYDVEANGARVATFKTRTHAREYGQAFANKYRVQVKLREV
jgi:hypothetical protein